MCRHMFDLDSKDVRMFSAKYKQAIGRCNSPKLVGSQIFYLGMGEIKTLFDIIMTFDSFKSRNETGQPYNST